MRFNTRNKGQEQEIKMKKTGVLLINLGTPDNSGQEARGKGQEQEINEKDRCFIN